jgi:hypothetical protein
VLEQDRKTFARSEPIPANRSASALINACFKIEGHHNRRLFAGIVSLVGEALNLGAVPLKACHPILMPRIAALDTIESFAAHPANNVCGTIHHRKPDATRKIMCRLPECRQSVHRMLLEVSDVVFMQGVSS